MTPRRRFFARRGALLGGLAAAALVAAACGTARKGEPLAGELVLDPALLEGARVYAQHCDKCHPGGEAGLGPSLNDKPLPSFLIRTQVRAGMGVMPSFGDDEIDDASLDRILDYLDALDRHGG
jgi:mono/diheme cytochrome c family protein